MRNWNKKQHLPGQYPEDLQAHALAAGNSLPGKVPEGQMRNWNKKQHLPGQYPEDLQAHALAAGNSLPGKGTGRADAELE